MFGRICKFLKAKKNDIDVFYLAMNIPDKKLNSTYKDHRERYFIGHGLVIGSPEIMSINK